MHNILRAFRYIPQYKRKLTIALVIGVVSAVFVTAIPLAIQRVIDNLFEAVVGQKVGVAVFLFPFTIWLGLRLALMFMDWLREIVEDNLVRDSVVSFRLSIMERVDKLSINYFEKHRTGEIVSEINQSPFKFGDWILNVVSGYLPTVLNAVFALVVLAYKFPPIALVILALAAFYSWYIFRTMKKNRRYWKISREKINKYTGIATENVSFVAHIRALGVEKIRSKLFSETVAEHDANMKTMYSYQHRRNFGMALIDLVLYGLPITIFAVRALNGDQQPTDIYILAIYLGTISSASARLARMWSNTADVNDTLGDTLAILDNVDSVQDPTDPQKLDQLGQIDFESISFKYEGTNDDAIKDFSLSIRPGETVALVGRSGSGKSTLTKLLLRFYDPQDGSIAVNGINIRDVLQEDLRSRFGVVMQDVALFNDTVANNIAVGKPDATRKEIEKAAKIAHAHEFISALPDGYDTLVGERGVKLSGGEKQRVSIARAVLRDPEAVLLDEATSALDSESEKYVQEGLQKLLKGRTAVVIAHRLSTIAHADKIVVMDKGRIVEEGTFAQLKKKKGVFADLLAHQQL